MTIDLGYITSKTPQILNLFHEPTSEQIWVFLYPTAGRCGKRAWYSCWMSKVLALGKTTKPHLSSQQAFNWPKKRLKRYGTYWIETVVLQIRFWILDRLLAWMLYSLQFFFRRFLMFLLGYWGFLLSYFSYIEFKFVIWKRLATRPTMLNWSFSWKFNVVERYDLHNLAVFSITLWCSIHNDF